ncbi:MAG: hypothetical protein AB7V32_06930 [Candidatus Berkiella sp.]
MSSVEIQRTQSLSNDCMNYSYEIQQPRAKLKEVTLAKRPNGDLYLRASFSSKYQAKIFKDYCNHRDIPADISIGTNKDVYFTTRNLQQLGYLIEQFSQIDRFCHAYIPYVLQDLNITPVKSFKMPSWVKHGNFAIPLNCGADALIDRSVEFNRTSVKSDVKRLCLNFYKDDGYAVVINFKSTKAFDNFAQMLQKYGFPTPQNTNRYLKQMIFWNHDKKLIAQFLKVFAAYEPAFIDIQNEAAQTVGLDFSVPLQKHRTMLTGDFTKPFYNAGRLNRQLKLDVTQQKKHAHAIELLGFNNGDICINIRFIDRNQKLKLSKSLHKMMRHLKRDDFEFSGEHISFVMSAKDKTKMLLSLSIARLLVGQDHAPALDAFYKALKLPVPLPTLDATMTTIATLNKELDEQSKQHVVIKLNDEKPKPVPENHLVLRLNAGKEKQPTPPAEPKLATVFNEVDRFIQFITEQCAKYASLDSMNILQSDRPYNDGGLEPNVPPLKAITPHLNLCLAAAKPANEETSPSKDRHSHLRLRYDQSKKMIFIAKTCFK